ncbi:hypothetical protein [Streptomyces sp. MMG1533]|uniref:hypothetical protein n=1 Tax=Streptomyces sp. MMG1533 TaxID=1415546 RepID=UPI000ADE3456|nr:hypothetical protein [Streptomyces sp. MMG1533]
MKARFTAGLLLGASASGIAYACSAPPLWVFLIGLIVAFLVWFGEFILDDLL